MQQIQIEPVGREALQRLLAGRLHAAPARVVRVDLADEKHVVAHTGQRFAQQRFRRAVAVHFRGVDERHAEFDARAHRRYFRGALRRPLAHLPRALPQLRDAIAVGQRHSGKIGRHGFLPGGLA